MNVQELIERCRTHCPDGVRPSSEEAMVLVGEIDRLRAILEAADHTLTVHGKIDYYTPLHQRIAAGAAVA